MRKWLLFSLLLASPALADSNPATIPQLPTIAALQALGTAASQYPTISVQGYATAGDGGGGVFNWNSSSTATADGGTIIQATGVSTGRYLRQMSPNPQLNVKFFGAKCDGSTDDSTALQNAENAAVTLSGAVTYPGGQCNFASTITLGAGVQHRGLGMGQTTLYYTGTSNAMKRQNPNGTQIIQAPSFFDFTLSTPNLTGTTVALQLNSIAGGFTDDSSTQQYMFQPIIQRVLFQGPNSAGIAFQCSKCFDLLFANNNVQYYATAVDVEGSDVADISDNALFYASTEEVLAVAHNTFGNNLKVAHNDMPGVISGGTAYIKADYRSAWIEDNHLEDDSNSVTTMIEATGSSGAVYSIHDNVIDTTTSQTPCWFSSNGGFTILSIKNNLENAGPSPPPACFGSGSGALYWYNIFYRQLIDASANLDYNAGFPFVSAPESLNVPAAVFPITGIGSVVWDFTPNLAGLTNGDAGTTIYVNHNAWVVPPSSSGAVSQVDFQGATTLPSGVDVWVCGYAGTNGQGFQVLDGNTVQDFTMTTTNTCQKVFANDTFSASQFLLKNYDTTTNSNVYITEVKILLH